MYGQGCLFVFVACLASIVSGDGVDLAVQSISLAYAFIIHGLRLASSYGGAGDGHFFMQ